MINIISACTNSKKHIPIEALKIETFNPDMSLDNVIQIWNNTINKKAGPVFKAKELYKGGAWQASLDTNTTLSTKYKTDLYVASAGYGLIHAETEICSYDSTFSSSTINSITKFVKGSSKTANIKWWNAINSFPISSFPEESYFFIVLPRNYLFATQDMIKNLIDKFNKNVFIFVANKHSVPSCMEQNIIKFDSRFNNFKTGILSNMLQRAVLWISNEIVENNLSLSHSELQNHIEQEMQKHKSFVMPIREKLTEKEIREKIKNMILNDHIPSATKGLKLFRSNGYACEQKRFGQLFKEVKGTLS